MTDRLRAVEALGEELERVARIRAAAGRRSPSAGLGVLAVGLVLLALCAAAAAAVLLIKEGSPLPAPHAQDLRSEGLPLPGSGRLAGLDAPDPDGGEPAWDLRLSRTGGGETCTTVGQVLDGRLGIVGLDGVFRALPLDAVDSCGVQAPGAPVLVGAQTFVGRSPREARTVVSGVAGNGVRSVSVEAGGAVRRLRLGPDGSFVTVYRGEAEEVRPTILITAADGRRRTIPLEQLDTFTVPDPQGGAGWAVSAEADLRAGASPDESCVQVTRENSQGEPGHEQLPLTPEICGHLARSPLFVQMRRFVPGEKTPMYPFGDSPARTIVYGVASPRVSSLTLTGAGRSQAVPIDRQGGGFAAVLDGHVDPRSLTLLAHLGDGQAVSYRRPTTLLDAQTNRPLAPAAVPAYRSPLPITQTLPPPFALPIVSTVRETLHASDPDGGPEWVLRTWRASANPSVPGVPHERFLCSELGVRWHGKLVQATTTPSSRTMPLNVQDDRCDTVGELSKLRYLLSFEPFVNDPDAYAPRPGRVVLDGLLPPGATGPLLLGAGPARRLVLDANGGFLAVLPGDLWKDQPRISYLLHGHRVGGLSDAGSPQEQAGGRPQVRAPDPDGAAPWGFAATRDCNTAIGRVIEGRIASIDPDGALSPGAMITGGSSTCLTHDGDARPPAFRHQPVEFDVQIAERANPFTAEPERLGEAEAQRRTLPGRTIITGIAEPSVASITISTPSDVRTLRPEGPLHTILSVYAGFFLRGAITATIRYRDGHRQTEQIKTLGDDQYANPPLAVQARHDREQVAAIREEARHDTNARRMRAQQRAIGSLEQNIATIDRRIAYEQGHPGLLPAE